MLTFGYAESDWCLGGGIGFILIMRVWMRIVGMLGRFYILKETFMDTGALQTWKGFIFGMCNWLHNLSKLTFNYAGEMVT